MKITLKTMINGILTTQETFVVSLIVSHVNHSQQVLHANGENHQVLRKKIVLKLIHQLWCHNTEILLRHILNVKIIWVSANNRVLIWPIIIFQWFQRLIALTQLYQGNTFVNGKCYSLLNSLGVFLFIGINLCCLQRLLT